MQADYYPINKWAKDDRPREKLLSKSPQSLSTAELLAILINTGTPKTSALDLSKRILQKCHNNLVELGKLSVRDLMGIKGIGLAKATTLAAAFELGRRRESSRFLEKARITRSLDIVSWLQINLKDYRHEIFGVVYLNNAGKLLEFSIVSEGGLTGTTVDPRMILKKALELDALSLILCHNHPSGALHPSQPDKELTGRIAEGARYLGIKLLDHIIVSEEGYFSFADHNML